MEQLPDLLTVALMLASLALWGIIIERLMAGDPLVDVRTPATRSRPLIAVALTGGWIFYGLIQVLLLHWLGIPRKVPDLTLERAVWIASESILTQILMMSVFLLCLTGLGSRSLWRYGIGFDKPLKDIGLGAKGYLAAMLPVVLVGLAMKSFHSDSNKHPYFQLLDQQNSWMLFSLLGFSAVILAPVGEELTYRVIFQGALQRWLSPGVAILISSLVFSSVHGFPDALSLMPLALILGYLYWKTGSYVVAVTTHAVFNGVNFMLAILQLQRE